MKLTCLQKNLSQGLSVVSHLASVGKIGLPILANILLEAKKEGIYLTATNLETAIQTLVRAKVEKEGKITLPAQLLTNYVDLLPDEPIEMELVNDSLEIEVKNYQTKIRGIPADEFPIIPQIDKKNKYQLKASNLKEGLSKTVFAVASNETRMEISGVLFNFNSPDPGKLTLVGTDSYRLAEKTIDLNKYEDQALQSIIVPLKTVQEVLRILSEKEEIEIYPSENQILFVGDQTNLISRIISGQYPDYQQIVPQELKTKILVERDVLLKAIKAASLFSRTGTNDVSLKFKKDEIIVSSLNSQLGENLVKIEADLTGEENEIIFNYRYLIDGLLNIEQSEVTIEGTNDMTPVLIKSPAEKNYLYLVMPIRG